MSNDVSEPAPALEVLWTRQGAIGVGRRLVVSLRGPSWRPSRVSAWLS